MAGLQVPLSPSPPQLGHGGWVGQRGSFPCDKEHAQCRREEQTDPTLPSIPFFLGMALSNHVNISWSLEVAWWRWAPTRWTQPVSHALH